MRTFKERIIEAIDEIPETRHDELLLLIERFKSRTSAVGKSKWAEYAGILSDEDACIMKAAILEEFGKA